MWLSLSHLWCRWQLIDRLVLLTALWLCSLCQPNCASNCVAVDHNCAETLSRRPNNDTVWYRCGWVNVFLNLIADWSYDCTRDICAVIPPNVGSCGRPEYVIGKNLFRIRCIWMASLSNECTWMWRKTRQNKNDFELERGKNTQMPTELLVSSSGKKPLEIE